jgi:hypothetical protein
VSAVAVGPGTINLSWTGTSSAATSYTIWRSVDGVNFTVAAAGIGASATAWSDPSALSAGTTYYYEIAAVGAAGTSTPSSVVSATTLSAPAPTYVSDLIPTSATVGYGTLQKDQSISGNTLTLNGTTYAKGLGAHAASIITYNLGGKFNTFTATVGIDQEEDSKGQGYVDFQVIGDGRVLFDSGVLTNDQTAQINISVSGVQTLTLVAANGIANDIDFDHADWAGAQLS